MKLYRKATLKDGFRVLKELREDDKQEVEGMGFPLLHAPIGLLFSEHPTYIETPDGSPGGIAGVVRINEHEGQVWLLCTNHLTRFPIHTVRAGMQWLREVEKDYRLLWNLADARNHVHHKLLKLTGFKALRSVPTGPDHLPYYEIVKLCA
jgi:hypothetical protein